ncbi:MAG: VPLPA-CTERM sorting domain-containing protein [Silicimonas sp.]|nr:VPLPA-CTERM sorting domain-containing protein [Silicimonas sp.]
MKEIVRVAACAAAVLAFGTVAKAATIDAAVPSGFIESVGGNEWVWGSRCSPGGCSGGTLEPLDLSFQGSQGWRIPTVGEITGAINSVGLSSWSSMFVAVGCAAKYFTSYTDSTCSSVDINLGNIYNYAQAPDAGNENLDLFLVRSLDKPTDPNPDQPSDVPVPASLPLLLAGVAGFGLMRRRKAAA